MWLDRQSDAEHGKKIVNLFKRNPTLTLRQGAAKLKQKGIEISHTTIRTHLLNITSNIEAQ